MENKYGGLLGKQIDVQQTMLACYYSRPFPGRETCIKRNRVACACVSSKKGTNMCVKGKNGGYSSSARLMKITRVSALEPRTSIDLIFHLVSVFAYPTNWYTRTQTAIINEPFVQLIYCADASNKQKPLNPSSNALRPCVFHGKQY